jgi:dTDP-4-dehydrorhamnose 3,5-epimerase
MKFVETKLPGVYLIELEFLKDDRGTFARSYCAEELDDLGIEFSIVQANISVSKFAGTVRGMHFQEDPYAESKIVRCTQGAIYDVAIDLRQESETYCDWFAAELNADNRFALLVPEGCAHGFQTLSDDTEVHYLMSAPYRPDAATGVRYNDPAFGIDWPLDITNISERDRCWPDFRR